MAIAFDSATDGGVNPSSSTTHSFSHTCSGSDRILFVGVSTVRDNVTDISGVTYNGVSMTFIDSVVNSGGRPRYVYYLVAPATGSNTVEITANSAIRIFGLATSYTGVDQTSPIGNTAKVAQFVSSGNTLTNSVTTSANNSWVGNMETDNAGGLIKTVANNRISNTSPDRSTGQGTSADDSGLISSSGTTEDFVYQASQSGGGIDSEIAMVAFEMIEAGGGGGGGGANNVLYKFGGM